MQHLMSRHTCTRDPQACTIRSEDGSVRFTLAPTPTGVFVERVQLRGSAARIVQSALFTDDQSFLRWCDADSVKFDHPLVYVSLLRDGDALFRRTK